MKRIKKVCITVLIIILSLLILYNIYNIFNVKVLKKDMTSIFGYTLLEVMSSSMEPAISKEDFIIINQQDKKYKKGDIITFYDDSKMLVTHRIIKIEKDKILTKGDHNKTEDNAILKEKIVGKYVLRIKGGGKVVTLLKNPFIIIIVVILIILLSALDAEKNMTPLVENEQEYRDFLNYKDGKVEENKKENEQLATTANITKKKKNNHKKRKKRAKRKQQRG